jgi:hypothetical protein
MQSDVSAVVLHVADSDWFVKQSWSIDIKTGVCPLGYWYKLSRLRDARMSLGSRFWTPSAMRFFTSSCANITY